jgi:hypothetical protein
VRQGDGGQARADLARDVLLVVVPDQADATTRFYPSTPPPWTLTLTGPANSLHLWNLRP